MRLPLQADRTIGDAPDRKRDDLAGSFVATEVYDGIDSHRIPDWTKVTPKDEV